MGPLHNSTQRPTADQSLYKVFYVFMKNDKNCRNVLPKVVSKPIWSDTVGLVDEPYLQHRKEKKSLDIGSACSRVRYYFLYNYGKVVSESAIEV